MNINIHKIVEMALYFLSKDGRPFSKRRLNAFMVLSDIKNMEHHTFGITEDSIRCMMDAPTLHMTPQVVNGYIYKNEWGEHIMENNENMLLVKQNKKPVYLTQSDQETIKQVFVKYGDLDEMSICYITKNMSMDWHNSGDTNFNPFLFFKSLRFTDDQAKERERMYLGYMEKEKVCLNEFFQSNNSY